MNRKQFLLASAMIGLTSGFCFTNASAQSQSSLDWVRIQFSVLFNREPFDWSRNQVEKQFNTLFDRSRLSGDLSISARDEKLAEEIYNAKIRANTIREVISSDLNGDNKVTREEIRSVLRYKYTKSLSGHRDARMQREFDKIMRNDLDRDGSITLDEIRKSVDIRSSFGTTSRWLGNTRRLVPLSLDINGDGKLTRDEFLQSVNSVFAEIDTNKDQTISESEMQTFMLEIRKVRQREAIERRKLYSAQRMARKIMNCRIPDWPKGIRPIFAAAYRGQALASVRFKDQQQLLSVTHLHIEEGSDNIALILSAPGNVIWHLTGVTERIAKVYLGSRFGLGKPASVAVVGIDKSKVHFIDSSACLPFGFRSEAERKQIEASLRSLTGQQALSAVAINNNGVILLPSGKLNAKYDNPKSIALPTDSPGSFLWSAVAKSFPSGIVRYDPKDVIAMMPVVSDKVLPGRAGLAQLIDQGAIEISGGAADRSLPVKELRIVAPIRIPSGIGGGIVRKFVLARNVKMPEGLQSQICIVSEEDGKPVPGSGRCR